MALEKSLQVDDLGVIQIKIAFVQKLNQYFIFEMSATCMEYEFHHKQEHRSELPGKDIDPIIFENFEKKVTAMLKRKLNQSPVHKLGYKGSL